MSNPSTPNQPEASAASSPHIHRRREDEDEGDLNKTLSVPRFQHILRPAASVPDELLHSYHEEDIEYHRHSSRHIHRPLSKLPTEGRRKKSSKKWKKDKNRKGSRAPSSGPIEEGEDEEEEEEEESIEAHSAPSESEKPRDVEFYLVDEDQVSRHGYSNRELNIVPQSPRRAEPKDVSTTDKPESPSSPSPASRSASPENHPLTRVSSTSRSYDLQERRRTGNMTGTEQAKYQRIPTDESEALTLASADLDGIKSHRFEDVPGVRRHLVRKSTKGQVVHIGKDHKEPTTRSRKQDRTPHEVFVEQDRKSVV